LARAYLGEFERTVLMALVRLGPEAYGVTIRKEISMRLGRDANVGAVYTTLDRLEEKGFVTSRWGERTPQRGGRAKRHFEITAPGQRALSDSLLAISRMSGAATPLPAGNS
jgi:PadR family transcriptional regulator, regulatory protein PadR